MFFQGRAWLRMYQGPVDDRQQGNLCRVRCFLFGVIAACVGLAANYTQVLASGPGQRPVWLTQDEWSFVQNHPTISIGPDPGFAPIESFDSDGNYIGLAADYIHLIEQKLGIRFEVVRLKSWDEVLRKTRAREIDALPAAANTPQRQEYLDFAPPHLVLPGVILVRDKVEGELGLTDLKGRSVAIVAGYVWQEMIEAEHQGINIVPVDNLESGLQKLAFGAVDAMIATLPVAIHVIEEAGIQNLRVAGETGFFTRLSFGTRKDWPLLNSVIVKALAEITAEEKQNILSRWIGLQYKSDPIYKSKAFLISLLIGAGIIIVVVIGAYVWNGSLRRQVLNRTRELRDKKNHLNAIFDNAPVEIYLKDAEGRYLQINRRFEELSGVRNDDLVGNLPTDAHDPELAERTQEHDLEVLRSGKVIAREETTLTKRGRRTLYTIKFPVLDEQGVVVGLGAVASDVTELKEAEDKIRRSEAGLKESQRIAKLGSWELNLISDELNWSDEVYGIFDIDPEISEGTTKLFYQRVHPKDRKLVAQATEEAINENKPYSLDHRIILPNGETRFVHEEAIVELNGSGKAISLHGTVQDITDRHLAESKLKESRELLRALADNLPQFISVKDTEGRFQFVNKRFEEWTCLDSGDVVGKTVHDIYPPEQAARFAANDRIALDTRTIMAQEVDLYYPDGQTRTVISTRFPIFSETDDLVGLGTINFDINDRKQAENARHAALLEAEQANRAKSEFLAHMSHELRTPLNAITGFAQLMVDETFGGLGHPKYREYALDVLGSGEHLLSVINDVLDLSKIEAGEVSLNPTEFSLHYAINDCISLIRAQSTDRPERIGLELSDQISNVHADNRVFRQILLNLLSNANKFTPDDGRITVISELDGENRVSVRIRDTGIGISSEDMAKVLEPFGQARADAQISHEGTGLGLPLSQKLMELHGGTLELQSDPGGGTTVTLTFPAERTVDEGSRKKRD